MVLLYYSQNTPHGIRGLPLDFLAPGAVIDERQDYDIGDGNVDRSALKTIRTQSNSSIFYIHLWNYIPS